jgi:hypothetical protein
MAIISKPSSSNILPVVALALASWALSAVILLGII